MADFEPNVAGELPRRRFLIMTGLGLAAAAMSSGCQTSQKLQVSQSGAPKFERFRAEYRFQQADQFLNRNFGADQDEDRQTGLRTVAAETSWTAARLAIECPHPAGDPSLALLTLTLSNRSGPMTFVHKDVRELTVPRTDVELLISDLANRGYFGTAPDESGSAQLEIQIDRGRVDRSWTNDARLLDLARQALTAGASPTR